MANPHPFPGASRLASLPAGTDISALSILSVDNWVGCGQTTGPARQTVRGPSDGDYFVPILIFMDVPFTETTRMVVPVAGSFTPALGCSAYQNVLVSSNSGTAAWPRM